MGMPSRDSKRAPRGYPPHPRLFASREDLDRLCEKPRSGFQQFAQAHLEARAETFCEGTDFNYPETRHNSLLIRARILQGRVMTLLARWWQTGEERYRNAAVKHIRAMGDWEYWSWITMRVGNADWEAIFDLSYGENSMTLALAMDWLGVTLTSEERDDFLAVARDRSLRPFLAHTGENPGWWYKRSDTNWNTVCAGGAGLLALATLDALPEAEEVLERVETCIRPYFEHLKETGGGWPEGIGYWNYGMRYGFLYLLSHERTMGRKHPLLHQAAVRKTLQFPLDFCPNGIPSSFGDSNKWTPMPFHYAVARRLGLDSLLAALDDQVGPKTLDSTSWDPSAEFLMQGAGGNRNKINRFVPGVVFYKGIDWAVLADRLPMPQFYVAIRGGTTDVPHGHLDLMSYQVVVREEVLVRNIGAAEYLDTTFGPRRYELPEMGSHTKNTLFVNGVGITNPSRVYTRLLKDSPVGPAVRIDATEAMGEMRDGPVARFCGRLFVLLKGKALLIVDRFDLPQYGRMESRLHTPAKVRKTMDTALLQGSGETLAIAYGSSRPAVLLEAVTAPTTPADGLAQLRWCTADLHHGVTFATLMAAGEKAVVIELEEGESGSIQISATVGKQTHCLQLTRKLLLK